MISDGIKLRSITSLSVEGEYLIASGSIGLCAFQISDGKKVWEHRNFRHWVSDQKTIYYHTGYALIAAKISNIKEEVWKITEGNAILLGWLSLENNYLRITRLGPNFKGPQITMIDSQTGKFLWSHSNDYDGKKRRSYSFMQHKDKFLSMTYSPYEDKEKDLWIDTLDIKTGALLKKDIGPSEADPFNMCAPIIHKVGENFLVYFFNNWLDLNSLEKKFTYLSHPSCFYGNYYQYGYVYNVPSRKAGPLTGISAIGPATIIFDHKPGGEQIKKSKDINIDQQWDEKSGWLQFGGNAIRSHGVHSEIESNLKIKWRIDTAVGKKSFGLMNAERTGLTQPVIYQESLVVADMDGQRILGLDANTGKQKWAYHVGSRVDASPSLSKGLCVFVAKDGWLRALHLTNGSLAYQILITPMERYIGGQDKLESQWPVVSDVLVVDGMGYACAGLSYSSLGGVRALAFDVVSGEVKWAQCYHEERFRRYTGEPFGGYFVKVPTESGYFLELSKIRINPETGLPPEKRVKPTARYLDVSRLDDYLAGGVSIPRNAEDRAGEGMDDGRIWGKTIAFDEDLSVAYKNSYGGETWGHSKSLPIYAKDKNGKENLWSLEENQMTVSSMVLTNKYVFCVGYYQKQKKQSEVQVINRVDGKIVNAVAIDGLPSNMGMSIADKRLYITTKEGSLYCFE